MRRWATLALLTLVLAACGRAGDEDAEPGAAKRAADAAAAEGRWLDAAQAYGRAFALEDPVDARARPRAWLALRRAWALQRAERPDDALAWLRWSERLDPSLYPIYLERAMIHDGHVPHLAAPALAREGYERFLDGWRGAGAPEGEAEMAEHAARRIEALDADAD